MNSQIENFISDTVKEYNKFKNDFRNFSKKDIEHFIKKKNSDTGDYLKKIQKNILIEKKDIIDTLRKPKDTTNYTDYFQALGKCKSLSNNLETLKKNLENEKTFDGKKKLSEDSTINDPKIIQSIVGHLNKFISILERIEKIYPYDDN